MSFHRALAELAGILRLPGLTADADGSCAVQVGPVAVALLPHDERQGFTARTRIGSVAHEGHVLAMESLLAANLFQDGPASSVLAMDPGGDVYLLQHFKYAHLNATAFQAAFERFVDRAQRWQKELGHGLI